MIKTENQVSAKYGPYSVLFVASFSIFISAWMGSAINIALPPIGNEFMVDPVVLGWINTSFILAQGACFVPVGRMADIFGRKLLFTIGISIFTVSSVFIACSNSPIMLISFRAIQGIGGIAIHGIGTALIASAFPAGSRGKGFGIQTLAVCLGFLSGPVVGGLMISALGWRSLFIAGTGLSVLATAAAFLILKRDAGEAKGEKLDLVGSAIYGATLALLMYGFSTITQFPGVWLILIGAAGAFIFIRYELKASSPMLNLRLFLHNKIFTYSSLSTFVYATSTFSVNFLLSLFLQYIKGLTPYQAGLILIASSFTQSVVSPFTGRLSDKVDARIVASAGMVLVAAGLGIFISINQESPIWFIVLSSLFLGCGAALFEPPNANAVVSAVNKESYGVAGAVLSTMRGGGMVFSMAIVMLLLTIFLGRVEVTPEYYPAFIKVMRIAFIISAALSLAGAIITFTMSKQSQPSALKKLSD